jgi:hypothetical protein
MTAEVGASLSQPPFALTGLASRGGFSNWVFFFFPTDIVMIDVGMFPAIKAGAQLGFAGQFGQAGLAAMGRPAYGPQDDGSKRLDEWRKQLQAKAKDIRVLRDDRIRSIRLHMRAAAHQLFVATADGVIQKFKLMNRAEAEAVMDSLLRRFGSRFDISMSAPFAFFKRYAPFLMR